MFSKFSAFIRLRPLCTMMAGVARLMGDFTYFLHFLHVRFCDRACLYMNMSYNIIMIDEEVLAMEHISLQTAQTNLYILVERAAAGSPFIISKEGYPLVKVEPCSPDDVSPRIGFLKGNISVPIDFDHMGENVIAAMFDGGV